MAVMTRREPTLERSRLPVGEALVFVDLASGDLITTGLRCSLVQRGGGRLLGRSVVTPSGLHVWPDLTERWRRPPEGVCADVLVRDELQRFQPLSLPWPLPARPVGQILSDRVLGGMRMMRLGLLSAPTRRPPPGFCSIYGLLSWQGDGGPAAWARVCLTDDEGRLHEGASDAEGRLALHLSRSRPGSAAAATLQIFADSALGAASIGLGAPDVLAFADQPAVVALADVAGPTAYVPGPLAAHEPLILASQGLPPAHRELRLLKA
jgi:hypothetical protein